MDSAVDAAEAAADDTTAEVEARATLCDAIAFTRALYEGGDDELLRFFGVIDVTTLATLAGDAENDERDESAAASSAAAIAVGEAALRQASTPIDRSAAAVCDPEHSNRKPRCYHVSQCLESLRASSRAMFLLRCNVSIRIFVVPRLPSRRVSPLTLGAASLIS